MPCTGIKIRFEPDGPECRMAPSLPVTSVLFLKRRGHEDAEGAMVGHCPGPRCRGVLLSPPSSWLPTSSGRHRWSPAHLAASTWALNIPCFPSPESTQARFPLVSFQGADASDWIWCKIHDETVSLSDTQLPPTVLCQPLLE